jgi:DNA invertase Pin-like site-specific DNA recombinase
MRVAIYARVSTDRQETENQLVQLRDFCVKQDWDVYKEFIDYESGGKSDRTDFQAMFRDASQRKFDLCLFWALDRLSREGASETLQHLNRLTGYGVNYRSFSEPYFDSCGIFKDAIIAIMATLAKQERIRLGERTKAGLQRARLLGKRLGRKPVAVNASDVSRLHDSGFSYAVISRKLKVSVGTVHNLIHRGA